MVCACVLVCVRVYVSECVSEHVGVAGILRAPPWLLLT